MKVCALAGSLSLLLALIELLAGITAASPQTYYVSPNGDDRNKGTSGAPFGTIQKAADVVAPGDTVIVKNGVYVDTDSDNYIVRLKKGGTSTAWITFRSENQWGAVLDGKGNKTFYCIGNSAEISYVRIEGFEMKGCARAGHFNDDHHHVYFFRNRIHDIFMAETYTLDGRPAIYTGDRTHDFTFDSNIFYRIGRLNLHTSPSASESSCTTPPGYVWKGKAFPQLNTCYNHDHALYLKGNGHIIKNNVFYDLKSGWAAALDGTNDVVIHNTFIGDNPGKDGQLRTEGGFYTIENNIFYGDASCGVQDSYISGSGVIRNNLFYPDVAIRCYNRGTWTVTGNIVNQDPKFIDEQRRDFRLRVDSPAIDKASAERTSAYDIQGRKRPNGHGYDIGAFEFEAEQEQSR